MFRMQVLTIEGSWEDQVEPAKAVSIAELAEASRTPYRVWARTSTGWTEVRLMTSGGAWAQVRSNEAAWAAEVERYRARIARAFQGA